MNIPSRLLGEIEKGKVVLFLGAGAVLGARSDNGFKAPLGSELADQISDEFLGGKFKNRDLNWIAELAKSESDLTTLQEFVSEVFQPLEPASFHKLIPEFRWQGIATTNYDDIIEKAYNNNDDKVQSLVPFVSDRDKIHDKIKTKEDLPYVKLHGSITRTHDDSVPLILSHDQYATVQDGRSRLFNMVDEWGHEFTIVFIGHELYDSDVRQLLQELTELGEYRPRYYLVKPEVVDMEERLWSSRRITVLSGTFKEFMESLDKEIPKSKRALFKVIESHSHPIQAEFRNNEELSPALHEFLSSDVEYVHSGLQVNEGEPQSFYKGYNTGWYPIERDLDVRRNQVDTVLFEVVLANEEDRSSKVDFYLIKAEAGAGKSIFLRRLAWDAAVEGNCLCLYAQDYVEINYESLFEIYQNTERRIFLFIDNASDNIKNISNALESARADGIKLTIISAERINIWNIACEESLGQYLSESYQLRYLSREEIRKLIEKLEEHDSLGRLESWNREQQVDEFEKVAGRQLLVALHEVTMGKPFEEIIKDEYKSIKPQIAKSLYLSVCTLNRMDIPVRAGLIARVHNIPFERFEERLFAPLEHVVKVQEDKILGDFLYSARHSEIAEMVFEQILQTPDDKYSEYMKLLHQMNTLYSTDSKAFLGLIKANSILDFFPEYQMAKEIYELAERVSPRDKNVYHQRAIFEMKRDQPSFSKAKKFLEKSKDLDPHDHSIIHSLAELYRRRAAESDKRIEKEKCREESKRYIEQLKKDKNSVRFARVTLVKLYMNKLEELLEDSDAESVQIDNIIEKLERELEEGLQDAPGDSYLRVAESELKKLLKKHNEAIESLEHAFRQNERNSYVAIRLAKAYINDDNFDDAEDVLKTALEKNRNNKKIHYNYALVLDKSEKGSLDDLIYHYRHGFSKWDDNYNAQFWYARYCYESREEEKRKDAAKVFNKLREAWIPHDVRTEIRDKLTKDGEPTIFKGSLNRVQSTFGFINVEGSGREIFIYSNEAGEVWDNLTSNKRIQFEIGFTMRGPIATNISIYQ
ncbi:MAG: SIR2 family protein [Balneolaceae bacterium]|nr:SIR2 family protein [Balneolaceae bacterium]